MINTDNIESVTFDEIAYLHIRSFTNKVTKKKTHYYAMLLHGGKQPISEQMTYKVNEIQARKLNIKDGLEGVIGSKINEGDETIRFDRIEQAICAAINYLKKNRPDIKVLIQGEINKDYPQYVIFGPEKFRYVANSCFINYKAYPDTKDEEVKLWKSFFKCKK